MYKKKVFNQIKSKINNITILIIIMNNNNNIKKRREHNINPCVYIGNIT